MDKDNGWKNEISKKVGNVRSLKLDSYLKLVEVNLWKLIGLFL